MLAPDPLLTLPHSRAVRRALKSLMLRKSLTQRRLALAAGIPERTLKRNMGGGRIRSGRAAHLCKLCGIDMASVLENEDAKEVGPGSTLQDILHGYATDRPRGADAYRRWLIALGAWVLDRCVALDMRPVLIVRSDSKFPLQVKIQLEFNEGELEVGFEPALGAPLMHVAEVRRGALRHTVATDVPVNVTSVDRVARWLSNRFNHGK